jgi:hypothetical protein
MCHEAAAQVAFGLAALVPVIGDTGVSANSQLTLPVDHSMKPVNVAESTAIALMAWLASV